jgi:hypothetical protein
VPFGKNKNGELSLDYNNSRKAPQSAHDRKTAPASLSIEAALVFPLVLFVILFFFSFFRVMQVEQMTQEALALAGAKVSIEAGAGSDGEDGAGDPSDAILYATALAYFHHELSQQSCPVKHVLGGSLGFSFAGTSTAGEYLDLRLEYRISLPGGILERMTIPVRQRVYLKKWTGYHGDGAGESSGEWVFMAETGTVYHLSRECTHLKLSIHTLPSGQAMSDYSPCKICGKVVNHSTYYYVTQEGDRYHSKLDCSGLKRTVYMIRITEIGGKGSCSRCG